MIAALALPIKIQAFLTIAGQGWLLFLVFFLALLIGAVISWIGTPVSTQSYIAICGLYTAIFVLVAAAVVMIKWPTWVRVAVLAPATLAVGLPMLGWWPTSTRQWRLFGILLACFAVFCVAMTYAFHV